MIIVRTHRLVSSTRLTSSTKPGRLERSPSSNSKHLVIIKDIDERHDHYKEYHHHSLKIILITFMQADLEVLVVCRNHMDLFILLPSLSVVSPLSHKNSQKFF